MNATPWQGVFPALTTPFTEDDRVDRKALSAAVSAQLSAGVHGLIALGSLGENATLDRAEKLAVIDCAVDAASQRVPVLACVAESGTREAVDFVDAAQERGVDGFMVLPPMRHQGDRAETLTYLRTVAAAARRPIMLYNNPIAYGTDLVPEDFVELANLEVIHAIKESSADTRRMGDIRRLTGTRFRLFCGVDDLALESFAVGADGWVAGLVNAFPEETVRLYELAAGGRWEEARALYDWFLPLLHLDVGPKFVQQIKRVQELRGMGSARVRAPRLALSQREAEHVDAVYRRANECPAPL